jgi:membrane protein YdbS with pleckstrin-like domain
MAIRTILREGEVRIISVTPVSRGIFRPVLVALTLVALVIFGGHHVQLVHEHQMLLGVVLAGPFAVVTLTRTWRWRSHKVHVTNERILVEGGVLHHRRSAVELRDIAALRIDQRVSERLTRRGVVFLETVAGTLSIGKLRHPGALCRLIDAERSNVATVPVAYDTVFSYDEPEPFDYEVQPPHSRGRHELE